MAANATCLARGLARLGAVMSAGGQLEGRQFLTPEAWQAMHQHPLEAQFPRGVTELCLSDLILAFLSVT